MGSSVMFTNHFEFSLNIGLEARGIELTEASEKKKSEKELRKWTHQRWNTWCMERQLQIFIVNLRKNEQTWGV